MIKGLCHEDVRGVGVCFLLCEEDDKRSGYIGEVRNVNGGLGQHVLSCSQSKEPYCWTRAIAFDRSREV